MSINFSIIWALSLPAQAVEIVVFMGTSQSGLAIAFLIERIELPTIPNTESCVITILGLVSKTLNIY